MELKTKPLPALEDDQLKTPEHDKLCISLLEKTFLISKIESDQNLKNRITAELKDRDYLNKTYFPSASYDTIEHIQQSVVFAPLEIIHTKLEHPIFVGQNKFLVGYVDLLCTIRLPVEITTITITYKHKTRKYLGTDWSKTYDTYEKRKNFIIQNKEAFEEQIKNETHSSRIEIQFAIEVKPKIRSVG
jgi:hypothetical protein